MSIRLIATARFRHHDQMLKVGETFAASPIEAAAYTYQRIAKYPTDTTVLTTAVPAEAPPPKRRYRRRDLTAEPS